MDMGTTVHKHNRSQSTPPELPPELITHFLRGNVGPQTLVSARHVSRTWATACEDESLIVSVATYVDGLRRTQLSGLLQLTAQQVHSYPHRSHSTFAKGGIHDFFLYEPATVQRALCELGGIEGLQARPPLLVSWQPTALAGWYVRPSRGAHDETLHKRRMERLAFECMRKLPPSTTHAERQAVWRTERQALLLSGVL